MLDKQNIEKLKDNGILVCLSATPEVIYSRVKAQRHRPLLNVDRPREAIKNLLDIRQPYYSQANFTIDTSKLTVEETVKKIVKLLKR